MPKKVLHTCFRNPVRPVEVHVIFLLLISCKLSKLLLGEHKTWHCENCGLQFLEAFLFIDKTSDINKFDLHGLITIETESFIMDPFSCIGLESLSHVLLVPFPTIFTRKKKKKIKHN